MHKSQAFPRAERGIPVIESRHAVRTRFDRPFQQPLADIRLLCRRV